MKTTVEKTSEYSFNPELHPTFLAGKEAGEKATGKQILPWGNHPLLALPFGTPTINSEEWKKLAKAGWATPIKLSKLPQIETLRALKPQKRKIALTNALFQMGFRTAATENSTQVARWKMNALIVNPVKEWIKPKGLPPLAELICIENTIQNLLWGLGQPSRENPPSDADLVTFLNPANNGGTIFISETQLFAPIIQKTKDGWEGIEICMGKEDIKTLVRTIRSYPKNKYGQISILTDRNQILSKVIETGEFLQLEIQNVEPINKPIDLKLLKIG